ncbi:hypothetical protein [Kibdelosporangium philippinense]|uniref:hypothetical protein n=1 Tax=Kibdelosporangium philippinense TaxID=211113 RepID=UPI0036140F34
MRAYCQSIDPDPAVAQQEHARWVRDLGGRWVIAVRARRAGQIMPAVSRELPNIRAGLAYLREHLSIPSDRGDGLCHFGSDLRR